MFCFIRTIVMAGKAGKILFVILLATFGYVEIFSMGLYKIIPNTETCKVLDHRLVHNYTCKSKNINRTLNLGSKEIFYQPGVVLTNVHAHAVLYRKFATIYRQFMIDVHYDVCALLAGNKTILSQFMTPSKRHKYGNYNEPCPISGRRYEYNATFDQTTLPEMFPAGEYRLDRKSYTYVNGTRIYLTLTQSYGEVKYTTAEHWRK